MTLTLPSRIGSSAVPATPADLGFSAAQFPAWHAIQRQALELVLKTVHSAAMLCAPTGAGKSLIAAAIVRYYAARGLRCCILTATKALQDQYTETFSFLCDVRGLANYTCQALKKRELQVVAEYYMLPATYDNGPCHQGVACWRKEQGAGLARCAGMAALDAARLSNMVVTNYAMFLTGTLGSFDVVIADEAHLIKGQLDNHGKLDHPGMPDLSPAATRRWAQSMLTLSRDKTPSRKLDLERARLGSIVNMPVDYIKDTDPKGGVAWVPLKPRMNEITTKAKRLVMLSATVTESQMADLMGTCTPPRPWIYKAFPPVFPVQNRRVVLYPALDPDTAKPIALKYSTTAKAKEAHMQHAVALLQALLALGWKGIVHTVSYDRAKQFVQALQTSLDPDLLKLMFYPASSRNLVSTVDAFKQAAQGFLISPSVGTGYDFPYDLCRWQIVLKIPFPDTRSALLTARAQLDADYSVREAMSTLEQIVGRGTRNRDDWCETYVLDQSLVWAKKHASNSLKGAIVEISSLTDWFARRAAPTVQTSEGNARAIGIAVATGGSSPSHNVHQPHNSTQLSQPSPTPFLIPIRRKTTP